MAKDYYHDLLIPEVVRYAKLRSMDPENLNEYSAGVYAVWFTQNPYDWKNREEFSNVEEIEREPVVFSKKSAREIFGDVRLGDAPLPKPKKRAKKKKGVRFTAHTHRNEPLEPSPDDLVVYDRMEMFRRMTEPDTASPEDKIIHFIVDGFSCRRVGK